MPGAKADFAATSPKHVPGLAGIPEPRTKSVPARSAAPAPGTGVWARRAGLERATSQLQTPPRCRLGRPRLLRALTIVVDPGWLQELHCSAAAGLRPEPCVSLSASGPWSRRRFLPRRPPSGRRPPLPSTPPRHRRPPPPAAATAASCARPPPPPPQPHPLRRSSSGGSGATPEVTARTCQIAPAGNRSLRGRGRLGSLAGKGIARLLRFGSGTGAVSGETRCGRAGRASRSRPAMRDQGSSVQVFALPPRLRVQLSN